MSLSTSSKNKPHRNTMAIPKGENGRNPPVDVQLLFLNGINGSILKYLKISFNLDVIKRMGHFISASRFDHMWNWILFYWPILLHASLCLYQSPASMNYLHNSKNYSELFDGMPSSDENFNVRGREFPAVNIDFGRQEQSFRCHVQTSDERKFY